MAPRKPISRKPAVKATKKAVKKAPAKQKAAATAAPVVTPTADRIVPDSRRSIAEAVKYRGNIPVSSFIGWVVLVAVGALAVGFLLAQMLVSHREEQLVEDTAARVALQSQARANVIEEWLNGVERTADSLADTQLVRLYVAEMTGHSVDGSMSDALRAQTPYMEQMLKDFAARQQASGVHLVGPQGQFVLSYGRVPDALAGNPGIVQQVSQAGNGMVLPLSAGQDTVMMDVLRPIFSPSQEGTETPVTGVLWLTMPVGGTLSRLVAATPLDRMGERTALLQDVNGEATVVGQTSLAGVGESLAEIKARTEQGYAMTYSVVDHKKTFAALTPVDGAPFTILQEYRAAEALSLLSLYTPGIYTITALAVGVLAALMLALVLHFVGQRNATRVKLLGQTMDALVRMVEARDMHLAGHHARLARVAIRIANDMKMPVGERATLFYAAQLSAVGRLLVPRDLLAKKGKLTAAERKQLEAHIERAQEILGDIDFDLPVVAVIQQMYERVNGSGHPLGLKGKDMHAMAKVLGAADAYVAMTSMRSHRRAIPATEALAMMEKSKQFDPQVLKALNRVSQA